MSHSALRRVLRTPRSLSVVAFTTGLALLVAGAVLFVGPERLCHARGGRWGAAQEACFTRSCFKSGDCGQWAYPAASCHQLQMGDERAEVYFRLGNPDRVLPDEAQWHAGKASAERVVARFKADRLEHLSCPGATQ